jgi:hypothetical protein
MRKTLYFSRRHIYYNPNMKLDLSAGLQDLNFWLHPSGMQLYILRQAYHF